MAEAQEANNVLRGPWIEKGPSTKTHIVVTTDEGEEVPINGVMLIKHNHIAETLLTIVPLLFKNIDLAGFYHDEAQVDATIKDGQLVVESIKSLLCKHYGMYHPLQDVADQLFIHDGENSCSFANSIACEFKPMEPMIAILEEEVPDTIAE